MLEQSGGNGRSGGSGRVIARAVAQDGVGGKVVAQPDHDRAEIDAARLFGRLFRPLRDSRRGCLRLAGGGVRKFQVFERCGEGRGRCIDRELRAVDPAQLLRARMHMHEADLRPGNIEQGITLRRQFTHSPADEDDQVSGLDALQKLWIGPDADIASVTGMQRIEQVPAAERRATGSAYFCAKRPTRSEASCDQRLPPSSRIGARAEPSMSANFAISAGPSDVSISAKGGASATATRSTSMSSGMATTTGPGRPFAAV